MRNCYDLIKRLNDNAYRVPVVLHRLLTYQIAKSRQTSKLSFKTFPAIRESIQETLYMRSSRRKMTKESQPEVIPIVTIDSNGLHVSIRFPNDLNTNSTYHAPWLWSNDPYSIHPTSGQRRGSNIEYFSGQWKIVRATISELNSIPIASPQTSSSSFFENSENVDNIPIVKTVVNDTETRPFPPKGSLHPIGGIYDIIVDKTIQQSHNENPLPNEKRRQVLQVCWESKILNETKDSFYDLDWLHRCRYDDSTRQNRIDLTRISHSNAINATTKFGRFCYRSLSETAHKQDKKFDILQTIVTNGVVLIENAISSSGDGSYDYPSHLNDIYDAGSIMQLAPVVYLGMLLGSNLSHGNLYGNIFHVESKADANNIAYTSEVLCPHQDLAYYESPPGLQLLHCVKNYGVVGGQSTLIDCIAAAEAFRVIAPELFDILVQVDATFVKQRPGGDVCYRRPHIQLASSSKSLGGTDGEVVSVRWSPPFEGPLNTGDDNVERYFIAYSAFQRMLDSAFPRNERLLPCIPETLEVALATFAVENTLEYMLKPGEILIFNNQRLLHGRRSFRLEADFRRQSVTASDGLVGRHLIGCYTNIDDTLNEYRLLRRSRILLEDNENYDKKYIPIIGNGSSGNY